MARANEPDLIAEARERFAGGVLEVVEVLGALERHASSSLGVRALRELVPMDDGAACAALRRLDEMLMLGRAGDLPSLAGVTDPLPPGTAGARVLDEERFMALRGFLDAGRRLRGWFADRSEDVPALAAVAAEVPDLSDLIERLDQVLDERGRVRRDASDLLARLRRRTSELSEEIDDRVRKVLARSDVRTVLSDGSVHRRGGRPVLAVRAKSSGHVKGIVHDRSSSGESVFVEPKEVIELGNLLAEAQAGARRETERILLELSGVVRERRPELERAAPRASMRARGTPQARANSRTTRHSDPSRCRSMNVS